MTSAQFHGDSPIDVIGRREAWRLHLEASIQTLICELTYFCFTAIAEISIRALLTRAAA
jgi:hypothetical protein